MNILFLSHSFWGGDFRVGSHHLSKNMARRGHRIFYVPVPVTPFHLIRHRLSDYRIKNSGKILEIEEGLFQFIPRLLFPVGHIFWKGDDLSLMALDLRRAAASLKMEAFDIVFLDEPRLYGMLKKITYKKLIYRPTDMKAGVDFDAYFKLEGRISKLSDAVIATSKPVMDSLERLFDIKVPRYVQENGVDLEHFRSGRLPLERIDSFGGKKCIYVGAFDDRFDFDGVEHLVENTPDVIFFFVGPDRTGRIRNISADNCKYLGAVPFDEIPNYLHACDVAIMPFSSNPLNDGRSPMKLYEYLAAGLPVVARRTHELARRNLDRVFLYDHVEQAIEQIGSAAGLTKMSQVPKDMDWTSISDRMLRFCSEI